MTRKSLADWLLWQESLHPSEIDLGLERVAAVAARLPIAPPADSVFTIAGTNGKGSTAGFLESLMSAAGRTTGVYTSPHLVRYNERVRVNGQAVSDRQLVESFEAVESARGDVPLTYFEFGTLAALEIFSRAGCRVWILEVGLGGRLDAVNVVDPDYSLITTVALDHQEWLGATLEEIALEKAGILRAASPAFYGDRPCPAPIEDRARDLGTSLYCFGTDFTCEVGPDAWTWQGRKRALRELPVPDLADDAQFHNLSLALAAIEEYDPGLLEKTLVSQALESARPPGRFQLVEHGQQWVLDVAHNPQAARVLGQRLRGLGDRPETTAVVGMLASKQADAFARELAGEVDHWVTCSVGDARAVNAEDLAATIARVACAAGDRTVETGGTPEEAFALAGRLTADGGRILVCGSFHVVGPALRWLGLY
jgi:dihydrofolate synthase/folylpolyglutamate synthase